MRGGHRAGGDDAGHRRSLRRVAALAAVAAVVSAGGYVGSLRGSTPPRAHLQPAVLASEAAPAGSQSSSWYCLGAAAAGLHERSTLLLANAGARPVSGSIRTVGAKGVATTSSLTVPPGRQVTVAPGVATVTAAPAAGTVTAAPAAGAPAPGATAPAPGATASPPTTAPQASWWAGRVNLAGGSVVAIEAVSGPSGWAVAPCASETSPDWYFATGSTAPGDSTYLSLYNPTSTLAVANLSFVTTGGLVQPQPYQGLVVAPGKMVTEAVGKYVQHQPLVSTEVSCRSGRVVAAQMELHGSGGPSGVSVEVGAPSPSREWELPRTDNLAGGTSQLVVLNPTAGPERVRAAVRVLGRVATFGQRVAAGNSWVLDLDQQARIPVGAGYSVRVTSAGGAGVVVGRVDGGPAAAPAPQWGASAAMPEGQGATTTRWLVPNLTPVLSAAHASLSLGNPGLRTVRATVSALTPSGDRFLREVAAIRVPPRSSAHVVLSGASSREPLLVSADGPVEVTGDDSPLTEPGLVTFPAVPLSSRHP